VTWVPRRFIHYIFHTALSRSVEIKATVVYPFGRAGWSAEDASTLIACRRRGDSFEEIQAKHFPDRTLRACRKKYNYSTKLTSSMPASRRRPRQPWSDDDDEHVMCLRDQGKTVAEIQELAYPKCSLTTLQRRLTRLHANRHPGIVHIRTSKLWSVEEKLRLQELHGRGLAVRDISLTLKRNAGVVREALGSLNLKPNRALVGIRTLWSKEDCKQLEPFVGQRINHEQCHALASRLNRSTPSVLMKITELRKGSNQSRAYRSRTWTAEESLDIDNMYAQGLPWDKIAARCNCSTQSARSRFRRMNKARPEHERPKGSVQPWDNLT